MNSNMITEDYVSFETAKLLREKGFKEPTLAYAYGQDMVAYYSQPKVTDDYNVEAGRYPLPTLQMAMKWLREDKKILISIFCHIGKGYWFCIQHFIESPYKFATSESIHRKEEILGKIQYYDTYEGACEAAIKYCLENLI